MLELLATHGYSQVILLSAFALSLVLVCRCAVQLVAGSHRTPFWIEVVFALAALIVIGILAMDGMRLADRMLAVNLEPLPGAAMIGLAAGAACLQFRFASFRLPARELIAQPLAWGLLAGWLAATCWSANRLYETGAAVADNPDPALNQPRLEPNPDFVGISDRGREIMLYRLDPASLPRAERPARRPPVRVINTIGRADQDTNSNCYGWVFTGGRFLLHHAGVEMLLADNGYEPCSDPRAGDVIVYRLAGGRIVHVGLVSGVIYDGTVLIESKWELGGRYLHRPEDQPYSANFTYYRSPRSGHSITIRPQPATTVTGTPAGDSPG